MTAPSTARKKFAMTVTAKGQVTLPAEYRQIAGIATGDRIELILDAEGEAALRPRHGRLADLRGAVPWTGGPISDDDLEAMIARGRQAAGRKT